MASRPIVTQDHNDIIYIQWQSPCIVMAIFCSVWHSYWADVVFSVQWLYFSVHQFLGMRGHSWVTHCHSFPLSDYIVCLSHTRDFLMVCFTFAMHPVILYLGFVSMSLFACCLSVADRHQRGPSKRKWCVYDSATPFSCRDIFLCAFLSDSLFPELSVLLPLLYHSFPFPSISQDPRNDSKSQGTGNDCSDCLTLIQS